MAHTTSLSVQFIRIANSSLALASLSQARAALCELLSIRLFRSWSERTIELASVLLTPWDLYQGASDEVKQRVEEQDGDDEGSYQMRVSIGYGRG